MNKTQFMEQLKSGLKGYDQQEVADIIADYTEHFESAAQNGQSEEEVCQNLGSPAALAKAYKMENLLNKAKNSKNPADLLRAVLVFVTLSFFNLIFVMFPMLALLLVLIEAWALSLIATVVGLIGMAAPFFAPFVDEQVMEVEMTFLNYLVIFLLGTGILALGILLVILLWRLSKWLIRLLIKYIEANIRLIKTGNGE